MQLFDDLHCFDDVKDVRGLENFATWSATRKIVLVFITATINLRLGVNANCFGSVAAELSERTQSFVAWRSCFYLFFLIPAFATFSARTAAFFFDKR